VFADGRPDQLVRGVDIVGTPLVSLTKIVATSDTQENLQRLLRAESGSVPVSAVAPAILISEMEFAKKENVDRPAARSATAGARSGSQGPTAVKKLATLVFLAASGNAAHHRRRRPRK